MKVKSSLILLALVSCVNFVAVPSALAGRAKNTIQTLESVASAKYAKMVGQDTKLILNQEADVIVSRRHDIPLSTRALLIEGKMDKYLTNLRYELRDGLIARQIQVNQMPQDLNAIYRGLQDRRDVLNFISEMEQNYKTMVHAILSNVDEFGNLTRTQMISLDKQATELQAGTLKRFRAIITVR